MANFGPTQHAGNWNNISFEPFSQVQNTKVHSNYSSKSSKEAWLNQHFFHQNIRFDTQPECGLCCVCVANLLIWSDHVTPECISVILLETRIKAA